ncbi:MAG TPA: hypothetical protein VFV68_00780 [Agriterribacter sp.]|nr:hypothetical protein [Agriterribacter sp.]
MINTAMKTLFLVLGSSLCLITGSCKKDDTSPATASDVSTSVSSGSWKVTYFVDDNVDKTIDFSGYTFTFNKNGTVAAVKTGNTENGTWSAGNDDSTVKFIIDFNAPDPFEEISEDWHVVERTNTKIRLEHVSGGDGHLSYLTFEKM